MQKGKKMENLQFNDGSPVILGLTEGGIKTYEEIRELIIKSKSTMNDIFLIGLQLMFLSGFYNGVNSVADIIEKVQEVKK